MGKRVFFTLTLLLTSIILAACGPSQAERDAQATATAASVSATQTAQAPTPTPTSTFTPTSTPTLTPVPTPTSTPTPTPSPTPAPSFSIILEPEQAKDTALAGKMKEGIQRVPSYSRYHKVLAWEGEAFKPNEEMTLRFLRPDKTEDKAVVKTDANGHLADVAVIANVPAGESYTFELVRADGSKFAQSVVLVPRTKLQGKVVFTSDRTGKSQIWIMNADGSEQRQVTTGDEERFFPSLSPDGKRVVFAYKRTVAGADTPRMGIGITNLDRSGLQDLTTASADRVDSHPVWSPDGTEIAFGRISGNPAESGVWVVTPDGRRTEQVVWFTDVLLEAYANWHPVRPGLFVYGVNVIFFMTSGERVRVGPAIGHATRGERVRLQERIEGPGHIPAYSPDGKRVAYHKDVSEDDTDLFVQEVVGIPPRLTGTPIRLTEEKGFDEYPSWSPDGKYITFWSNRSGKRNIYVTDTDGKNIYMLTFLGNNDEPYWSR